MAIGTELAFDLGQLMTFYAVYQQGGIVAASKVLHRTQPAVSMRIKQLESSIGVSLFEKVGRSLQPTPAGRSIIADVESILLDVQQLKDKLLAYQEAPQGQLKIGALQAPCVYLLPSVMADFQRRYPMVKAHFTLNWQAILIEELKRGLLDCFFAVGDVIEDQYVHSEVLAEVRAVVVMPADSPLCDKPVLGVDDLRGQRMIQYGDASDPFFGAIAAFNDRHGLASNAYAELSSIDCIKSFVQAGMGLAILPDYTIVEPTFCTRPIEGLSVCEPFWMGLRSSSLRLSMIEAFCECVREHFAFAGSR